MLLVASDEKMNCANNYVISATVLERLLDAAAAARYNEVCLILLIMTVCVGLCVSSTKHILIHCEYSRDVHGACNVSAFSRFV